MVGAEKPYIKVGSIYGLWSGQNRSLLSDHEKPDPAGQ
jgi:hypothetical protein